MGLWAIMGMCYLEWQIYPHSHLQACLVCNDMTYGWLETRGLMKITFFFTSNDPMISMIYLDILHKFHDKVAAV